MPTTAPHFEGTKTELPSRSRALSGATTLSSFTETLGTNGCPTGSTYALSNNGTAWYYWNGSAWVVSNGTSVQANPASALTSNVLTQFSTQVPSAPSGGTLYFKAFLNSSGTQACQVDEIAISGL